MLSSSGYRQAVIRRKLKQIRKKQTYKTGGKFCKFLAKAHDCITRVVYFRSGSTIAANLGRPFILSRMGYL